MLENYVGSNALFPEIISYFHFEAIYKKKHNFVKTYDFKTNEIYRNSTNALNNRKNPCNNILMK